VKGWEKILYANGNQKRARVATNDTVNKKTVSTKKVII
jgi:hypothetical protein